jgi:hypothetical protein
VADDLIDRSVSQRKLLRGSELKRNARVSANLTSDIQLTFRNIDAQNATISPESSQKKRSQVAIAARQVDDLSARGEPWRKGLSQDLVRVLAVGRRKRREGLGRHAGRKSVSLAKMLIPVFRAGSFTLPKFFEKASHRVSPRAVSATFRERRKVAAACQLIPIPIPIPT